MAEGQQSSAMASEGIETLDYVDIDAELDAHFTESPERVRATTRTSLHVDEYMIDFLQAAIASVDEETKQVVQEAESREIDEATELFRHAASLRIIHGEEVDALVPPPERKDADEDLPTPVPGLPDTLENAQWLAGALENAAQEAADPAAARKRRVKAVQSRFMQTFPKPPGAVSVPQQQPRASAASASAAAAKPPAGLRRGGRRRAKPPVLHSRSRPAPFLLVLRRRGRRAEPRASPRPALRNPSPRAPAAAPPPPLLLRPRRRRLPPPSLPPPPPPFPSPAHLRPLCYPPGSAAAAPHAAHCRPRPSTPTSVPSSSPSPTPAPFNAAPNDVPPARRTSAASSPATSRSSSPASQRTTAPSQPPAPSSKRDAQKSQGEAPLARGEALAWVHIDSRLEAATKAMVARLSERLPAHLRAGDERRRRRAAAAGEAPPPSRADAFAAAMAEPGIEPGLKRLLHAARRAAEAGPPPSAAARRRSSAAAAAAEDTPLSIVQAEIRRYHDLAAALRARGGNMGARMADAMGRLAPPGDPDEDLPLHDRRARAVRAAERSAAREAEDAGRPLFEAAAL
eukprot:tig00020902_g14993.t1